MRGVFFRAYDRTFSEHYCQHPEMDDDKDSLIEDTQKMLPDCPEGGEFVITTKKLDNEDRQE
jgi:hypothetical protein